LSASATVHGRSNSTKFPANWPEIRRHIDIGISREAIATGRRAASGTRRNFSGSATKPKVACGDVQALLSNSEDPRLILYFIENSFLIEAALRRIPASSRLDGL